MSTEVAAAWSVILPVKTLTQAKSRIGPDSGSVLALAFFRDLLAAVRSTPQVSRVIVTTSDATIATIAVDVGCEIVDDSGHPGINAAAAWAAERAEITGAVAVMVSDLPCLTPRTLSIVLDAAARAALSFVPDADGSGTTMWLSVDGPPVLSHFGPDSARKHRLAGAVAVTELLTEPASIALAQRDVDTEADLADAIRMGVGAFTSEAVGRHGPMLLTSLGRTSEGGLEVADEDGHRHTVTWTTVTDAGFIEVRPGQRLILEDGQVRLP